MIFFNIQDNVFYVKMYILNYVKMYHKTSAEFKFNSNYFNMNSQQRTKFFIVISYYSAYAIIFTFLFFFSLKWVKSFKESRFILKRILDDEEKKSKFLLLLSLPLSILSLVSVAIDYYIFWWYSILHKHQISENSFQ